MNKTVLITGSSSGIGLATALEFQRRGWNVLATIRDVGAAPRLESLDKAVIAKLDVTNPDTVEAALKTAIDSFGKVDVVVNNAGFGLFGPFEYEPPEAIKEQFDVNVFGVMNVMRTLIPHFKQNGGGRFVNVSSMIGRISIPFYGPYGASKWALEGFSESVAYELEQFGIDIKLVEPGPVKTNFYKTADFKSRRKVGEYQDYYDRVYRDTVNRGKSGVSPETVAKTIYKAANTTSMQSRFQPDRTAKSLILLRRALPITLFIQAIKRNVGK